MNDPSLDALFRAARAVPPDTARAEFALETRVLARIRAEGNEDWPVWAWRLLPYAGAVAVACAMWAVADWRDGAEEAVPEALVAMVWEEMP